MSIIQKIEFLKQYPNIIWKTNLGFEPMIDYSESFLVTEYIDDYLGVYDYRELNTDWSIIDKNGLKPHRIIKYAIINK